MTRSTVFPQILQAAEKSYVGHHTRPATWTRIQFHFSSGKTQGLQWIPGLDPRCVKTVWTTHPILLWPLQNKGNMEVSVGINDYKAGQFSAALESPEWQNPCLDTTALEVLPVVKKQMGNYN